MVGWQVSTTRGARGNNLEDFDCCPFIAKTIAVRIHKKVTEKRPSRPASSLIFSQRPFYA